MQDRPHHIRAYDDGVDRWQLVEAAPSRALAGRVGHYTDYWEDTASFAARRELASTNGVLIDDIVDSAGTLANAAAALREAGAEDVVAYCTHGVLSGAAVPRVDKSALSELVVTDSIAAPEAVSESGKIRVLTIAPLLGEAIKRIADESSVSSLFD